MTLSDRKMAEGLIKLHAGCAAEWLGQQLHDAADIEERISELIAAAESGAVDARRLPNDATLIAALFAFEGVAAALRAGNWSAAAQFGPELRTLGAQLCHAHEVSYDHEVIANEIRTEMFLAQAGDDNASDLPRVDLDAMTVTLEDGVEHDCSSESALRWAAVLLANRGHWIKQAALPAHDDQLTGQQCRKLRPRLPAAVQVWIEAGRNGSRWKT